MKKKQTKKTALKKPVYRYWIMWAYWADTKEPTGEAQFIASTSSNPPKYESRGFGWSDRQAMLPRWDKSFAWDNIMRPEALAVFGISPDDFQTEPLELTISFKVLKNGVFGNFKKKKASKKGKQ